MNAKRIIFLYLILIFAVVGFFLLRSLNSLKAEHAINGVIYELERGVATQNEQLVKSLYSEKVRSGKTVAHAKMMNEFLSMIGIQNFRIDDIDVVVRGPSAIAKFRVTGDMVRDGEVIGTMDKRMMLQLSRSKSTGKWLIVGHGM